MWRKCGHLSSDIWCFIRSSNTDGFITEIQIHLLLECEIKFCLYSTCISCTQYLMTLPTIDIHNTCNLLYKTVGRAHPSQTLTDTYRHLQTLSYLSRNAYLFLATGCKKYKIIVGFSFSATHVIRGWCATPLFMHSTKKPNVFFGFFIMVLTELHPTPAGRYLSVNCPQIIVKL